MVRKIKDEKYKDYTVKFRQIEDVDGRYAVQSYINGRWAGTGGNKMSAFSLAKRMIDSVSEKKKEG